MDTERLANAIQRFAAMREEYGRVGELGDRLQEAVKESLIQRFEHTEEIAWKTGKRYLKTVEGYAEDAGPKPVYRQLGRLGLLDAAEESHCTPPDFRVHRVTGARRRV